MIRLFLEIRYFLYDYDECNYRSKMTLQFTVAFTL